MNPMTEFWTVVALPIVMCVMIPMSVGIALGPAIANMGRYGLIILFALTVVLIAPITILPVIWANCCLATVCSIWFFSAMLFLLKLHEKLSRKGGGNE